MSLKILNISKRRAAFELENDSPYYSDLEYKIYINGEYVKDTLKNVFHIENLFSGREYELSLVSKNDKLQMKFTTEDEFIKLNVNKLGAKGDGVRNDTLSIQSAIMACPENSTVYLPKGIYRVSSLFLKDNITIEMAEGAVIKGIVNRDEFAVLPGFTETTDEKDEYYLGSWEGNPLDSYSSIIQGINTKNVKFIGNGIIDGNAGFHNWWYDAKKKRGAWRPRTISLINCDNIVFEGIKVMNSPSWTVHPFFSNNLKFINMRIENPQNSPNTDGIDPESCKDLEIVGVNISVGDDCIAIKSGKIYLGKKLKHATENLSIRNCLMENGHGGVVIGSEIAAGVKNIKVEKCIFSQTDKGLRLKTRRGRGEDSVVSGIHFENILMDGVKAPFVLNSFYFCDPDGKSEYVGTKKVLPVDERTPNIKSFKFNNIRCENAHITAGFLCGLPERKVKEVIIEDVSINFAENVEAGVPAMMNECSEVKKQGFYFENIKNLKIKNLNIKGVEGPEIITVNIDEIERV